MPAHPLEADGSAAMGLRVGYIMTWDVACCTRDTSVLDVVAMMVEHDCGEIPVVEGRVSRKPIGVVTDRDIVCRLVAMGVNPLDRTAADCMSTPVATVTPTMTVEECVQFMEAHRIRRVPVVDEKGECCGIVAQADLARKAPCEIVGEVVREVSEPN